MESKIYKNKFLTMLVLMIALSFGMVKDVGGQTNPSPQEKTVVIKYETAGTYNVTIPSDVTTKVEGWGGGGAGGSSTTNGLAAGGGGGGAYATTSAIAPGNYTLTVANGGNGVLGTTNRDGENTTFGDVLRAVGGKGVANNTLTGGAGGKATDCTPTANAQPGGNGSNGTGTSGTADSGGGGGGAGSTQPGSNANGTNGGNGGSLHGGKGGNGLTSNDNGNGGALYAAGGGGGKRAYWGTGGDRNGGNGARGRAEITITLPTPTIVASAVAICEGETITLSATTTGTPNGDPNSGQKWEFITWNEATGEWNGAGVYTNDPLVLTKIDQSGKYKVRAHYTIVANDNQPIWGYVDSDNSVEVIIHPKPVITNTDLTQTVCNGTSSTPITLTSSSLYGDITSLDNVIYTWVNNNPNIISLDNSFGTTLPSFTVNNSGTTEVTATITITPSRTESGITCTGDPVDLTITVPGIPTIEELIAPEPFCAGKTINELITPVVTWNGPAGTTGWRWRDSQEGDDDFSGDTPLGVEHNNAPIYYYAKSICGVAESPTITLIIHGDQTISAQPVMQAACTGSALSDFIQSDAVIDWDGGATGTTGWSRSNQEIEEVALTETFSSSTTLYYYAKSSCGTVFSAPALITIDPLTVAGTVSAAQTICSGSTPGALTLSGNTGNVVKWQWSTDEFVSDINDIPNTSTTLTPTEINNMETRSYRAVVKSGACDEAYTEAVLITVNPIPDVEVELNSNNVVCSGDLITFTVTAINGADSLAYELSDGTNTIEGVLIPTSGQSSPYTVTARPTVTVPTEYTIVFTEVKNTVTGCINAEPTQYTERITVNPIPDVEVELNGNNVVCSGDLITFTVTAINGADSLAYELSDGTNTIEGVLIPTSGQSSPYTVTARPTVTVPTEYTIVFTEVKNTVTGCINAEPTQYTERITVNPIPDVEVELNGNNVVCSGDLITFTVTAINGADSLAYELSDGTNTIEGVLIPTSGQSSPYTVTARPTVTVPTEYTIVFTEVKNTVTGCINAEPTQYTERITVNPIPDVEVELNSNNVVCSGDLITFTVTAINGADSLAYELSDGTNTIEGVLIPTSGQSSPYTVTARPTVTVPTEYTIVFTEVKNTVTGCINAEPTQYTERITVNPIPDVEVELNGNNVVCSGDLITFTVTAINGADSLAYELSDGTNTIEGVLIPTSGQSSPYTVTARPTVTVPTEYTIVFTEVKNTVTGCINAEPTQYTERITVNPIPDVEVELNGNNVVCSGDLITFTVTAINGADSLAYELSDGTNTIEGVLIPTSGQSSPYTVTARPTVTVPTEYTIVFTEVKNTVTGCINAEPTQYTERITVNPIPDVEVELNGNNVVCSGDLITFTVTAINGADSLAYELSDGTNTIEGVLIPTSGQSSPYTVTARPTVTVPTEYTIVFTEVKNTVTGCINAEPTQYTERITVNPIPDVEVELNSNNVVCSGDLITFTVTAINGADSLAYELSDGTNTIEGVLIPTSGQSSPYTVTARPTVTVPTEYTIVFTEVKNTVTGCINAEPTQYTERITVNPIPDVEVELNGNNVVCSGDLITFTVTAINGADSLAYELSDGTNTIEGVLIPTSGQSSPYTVTARPTVTVPTEYTIVFTEVKNTVTGCINAEPTQYTERITVNPIPDVEVELNSNNVVCSGDLITFTVTAINGADSLAYELSDGTNTIEGVLIPTSGQSSPYTVTARPIVTVPTEYTIAITEVKNTVTGCINAEPTQYEGSITVNPIPAAPSITMAPEGGLICGEGSVTLTATAVEDAIYTWYLDDEEVEGKTGNTLTVDETGAGSYTVTVTLNGCTSAVSEPAEVIVNEIPVVILTPFNPVCTPTTIDISEGVSGASTYKYYEDKDNAPGDEIEDTEISSTGTFTYWVIGINEDGCESTPVKGELTINLLPEITFTSIEPLCVGEGAVTLTAMPTGGLFTGEHVTGNTFTPEAAGNFSVMYTYTDTETGCSNSKTITIVVEEGPEMTDGAVCKNGTATVSVPAGCEEIVGQRISVPSIVSQTKAFAGEENNNMAWTLGSAAGEHTNRLCGWEAHDGRESQTLLLTGFNFGSLLPDVPDNEIEITGIEISFQRKRNTKTATVKTIQDHSIGLWYNDKITPDNTTGRGENWPGTYATKTYGGATDTWGATTSLTRSLVTNSAFGLYFKAESKGASSVFCATMEVKEFTMTVYYTYGGAQWYATATGGDPIFTGNSITFDTTGGSTNSPLTSTATTGEKTLYVTCGAATCRTAVTMTVSEPLAPTITTDPVSGIICGTGEVTLTATEVTDGIYTWYLEGEEVEGKTNNALTVDEAGAGSYTVTVTLDGCTSAVSEPADVIVNDIPETPEITMNPVNGIICETGTVTLTATAVADAIYTWYLDGEAVEGKTGNTLTVDETEAGSYTVEVLANDCSSAVSAAVDVIVNDIPATPVITMNPENGIICGTGIVTLTATAVADATYTWYLEDEEVEGKTGNTLTVDEAGAGSYTVTVTLNGCTSEVSEPADVIVNDIPETPEITMNPVNGIICETGTVTLTATEVADAIYTWYLEGEEVEGETGNTLTVDEAGAGSYTVTVTLNDCTSEESEPADVIVNDIPETPSITMNPATGIIYGTGTVTLTATEVVNGIYTWYLGDNVVAGETTNILVVDQDHSGIYKVSVAVDGCSSEKSESVEVILEISVCIDGTMTLTAPEGCVAENTTGAISPTAVAQTDAAVFSRGDKAWTLGAAAGEHTIQLCASLSGGQESNALQLTGFNFDVLNNLSSDEVEITGISISFERKRNTGMLTVETIQDHSIGLLLNGGKLGNPNTSGRGTNWLGTYAPKTYGDATTTWGATLTKEAITNSTFGLYFVAEAKASGVGLVCAESAVRNFTMTVYYKTGGQWYTAESGGELVYTGNEVIFDADGGSTQSAWTSTATPGVKSLYLQCGDERTEMSVNVIDNQSVEWEATELLFADGDPEKINLTYEGFTPWSFTYSVNGGTDILVEDIEETTYSIDLSGYEIGDYVFELTNLNEGMCVTLPDPIALTIVDEVLPTDIEILNCSDADNLHVGGVVQMEAQVYPSNVTDQTIWWRSTNPTAAIVDENGLVTAKFYGSTYIIATTADRKQADSCLITVIVPPTSVTLNKTKLTMVVSTSEYLLATVLPITAINDVTWESSDETIATVDENGNVTAVAKGTATITVTTLYGNLSADCEVTVIESDIPATGIAITPKTLSIDQGETATLTATLKPLNATTAITWSSSNPVVATVDDNGTVTAHAAGRTTITAKTANNYKATCAVTVTIPVDEVLITPSECQIPLLGKVALSATVLPADASNKSIVWSSSNTAIATVNTSGTVSAKAVNGVVEIYATNTASGKKGVCVVTIGTGAPAVPFMSITEENELSNIELFPNPATSVLTVKFNGNLVQEIEIYNMQGQRISQQTVNGHTQIELNVENLPTGIYFIRADKQTLKFVKQ